MLLSDRIVQRLPLYASVFESRELGLESVTPLAPDRIKFIYSPDRKQTLFPGLYYQIPESLSLAELGMLEQAILKVIRDPNVDLTECPLDVPETVVFKFNEDYDVPNVFNKLVRLNGQLYLSGTNCLLVNTDQELVPTEIHNPSYGCVASLATTTAVLQAAVAMISTYLYAGSELDNNTVYRIAEDFLTVKNTVPKSAIGLYRSQDKPNEHVLSACECQFELPNLINIKDNDEIREKMWALFYCFYDTETNFNKSMTWGK